MIGRGIDQILPFPSNPVLHETYVKSALGYLKLAEDVHGLIPRPVGFDYVWGDALHYFEKILPTFRIINLETAVTTNEIWGMKGINYRMNPRNISCLTQAQFDCCVLANNHVLDWGKEGLQETIETLKLARIQSTGAGNTLDEAEHPAILSKQGKGRVLVFAFGLESSGIPREWAASKNRPGINFIQDLNVQSVKRIQKQVSIHKRSADIAIVSIHWGGNWGYEISAEEQSFAHALIDEAHVDIIHGHSSHHPKGIEIYHNKLILYGCGDFLNDYEGIRGYEEFRTDLVLMFFPEVTLGTGELISLRLIPLQIQRFRLNSVRNEDALWIENLLNREGFKLGSHFTRRSDSSLLLQKS